MRDYEIVDENRDRNTGELQSFLLIWDNGEPEMKNATPENTLLFKHGLYEFLNGNNAVILNDDDPEVIVAPTGMEYAYMLRVRGHTVETTPNQAESVLQGVMDVVEHNDLSTILSVHREIVSTQARQTLINALYETFSASDKKRITKAANGWLVDGFYLVDWKGNLYTKDDDPDEGDYERQGSQAVQTDKSYELVMLRPGDVPDPVTVTINGSKHELTEREMLFLAKVKWILGRTKYHPDMPFWLYLDTKNNAKPGDYQGN
ncbi:hypothetical protein M199_gp202 [Halogranum tailed virus 1]|uniref:Uncharacterized protein n=1 Tax=Halogranum tailed virus 1 TaxID=1273749 RepID=R4T6Y6_9CAUD|nr:hypothetical protein M199_gp202 [Halogranum tailed virus 1]AGM11464.1 hypothetical protein HGTV1_167 [Halogranum tailed virus 1]